MCEYWCPLISSEDYIQNNLQYKANQSDSTGEEAETSAF